MKTALDAKQNTLTFDSTPTASSTNPVTSGGVKTALDTLDDAKADNTVIADEFDSTATYAIDDLVIYQGSLYRFETTHAAGAWNSAHVVACTVAEVLRTFAKFEIRGSASSGSSVTFTDARINSEHWRVPKNGIYFGTPSNVTSNISWSTNITNHTITLQATFAGTTSVEIDMEWYQDIRS